MLSRCCLILVLGSSLAVAGTAPPRPAARQDARHRFVLDVVRSAVALPQSDPQDRLRVLHSAAAVVAPLDSALAHRLAREGAHLEAELLSSGIEPAVSVFSSGQVDCCAATEFVETLPAAALPKAEDSLLSAITSCKAAQEPARVKLESALNDGIVAARPLMALMEISGAHSRWSQAQFSKMFSSLPSDQWKQAPNFAAVFAQMAPAVDKDAAREAGLKFLDWLGAQKDSGERNLAVTMTTSSLRMVLGHEKYAEALRSDVVAQGVAQTSGRDAQAQLPPEDNVSVLAAMGDNGKDVTDSLVVLPAARRARDAAAHGFAAGTSGDPKSADHYFDLAFSAADEVWSNRGSQRDAPGVLEEVSEAAAQVDPVAALVRSQKLSDPSAQAISMLAVARVVAGQQH